MRAPKLTELEEFVFANGDRSSATLASELNRSEAVVDAAYSRAHRKIRDIAALRRLYRLKEDCRGKHVVTRGRLELRDLYAGDEVRLLQRGPDDVCLIRGGGGAFVTYVRDCDLEPSHPELH